MSTRPPWVTLAAFPIISIVEMPSTCKSIGSKPLRSLDAFDKLFERAFAPRETPIITPLMIPEDLKRPMAPEPPFTPLYSPLHSPGPTPHEVSLDPLWEEVRQAKERELAASPSKVKSLGMAISPETSAPTGKKVAKRRSSVSFRESPDGRTVAATFDIPGVKKQDMHVSYRTNRLIVSWRMGRVTEKREGDVLVRDREERRYSHTIPLPEGTKFDEVRAARDGRHLILTYPNSRCVRVGSRRGSQERTVLSGGTEFHSC